MSILVVGNGAWGSAVASLFEENGYPVKFWQEGERIPDNSLVFLAVPTQVIRKVLKDAGLPKNLTLINGAKGIEENTHLLPSQIASEVLENANYLTLMGPSFAEEVVNKMPTLVNLGYRDFDSAKEIKSLIQTDYFRVRLTKGIRSLELSAAFKNIYAISCGVADGLGFGYNTKVKLMLLAMEEFDELRQKLDFKIDGKALPATIGDLVLTCSSQESRNFRFGEFLVNHISEKSLELVGATVEGFYTVASVPYFEKTAKVKLPLARFVYDIAHGKGEQNIKTKFIEFVKSC